MPPVPVPDPLRVECPVCEAVFEIKGFDVTIEEPIDCPECLSELDWDYDDETGEFTVSEAEAEDEDEEDEDEMPEDAEADDEEDEA